MYWLLPMLAPSPFLKIPESRSARWALLESAIPQGSAERHGDWYTPLGQFDGFPIREIAKAERRLGFKLPKGLKYWYRVTGRREDIWSRQDCLLSPRELHCQIYDDSLPYEGEFENVLVFYCEHLGSYYWGIPRDRVNEEDPPVAIDNWGDWRILSQSVSEFALMMFISCLKWSEQSFWCCGNVTPDTIAKIEATIPLLNLPSWQYPGPETRFYGYKELMVEVSWQSERADDIYLFVTATTAAAFAVATQYLNDENFYCSAASWEL